MMHSVRRVLVFVLWPALVLVGCSPDETDTAAIEVCGSTVAFQPGYRLLGTTREDGVTVHYVGPENDIPEPGSVVTLVTSTDANIRVIERVERTGPETLILGSIESTRDRTCNGIVSVYLGDAAQQVLLDVDGASVTPWVAAINIGRAT